MSFGNPIWLLGLSGLLIPIAIHLLSRKEGKIIKIGSIRHLQETNTARFSSIRLNEILLLMLRCLILILIVSLLAQIDFRFLSRSKEKWLVVEPEVENEIPRTFIDSLTKAGFEKKYLDPSWSQVPINDTTRLNYWSLAGELSRQDVDAVVFSRNYQQNFYGRRAPKPENVKWIPVTAPPVSIEAARYSLGGDSLWIRKEMTNENGVSYATLFSKGSGGKAVDTIRILIQHSPDFAQDTKVLQACLKTITDISPLQIVIDYNKTPDINSYDFTFWLTTVQPPAKGNNSFCLIDLHNENEPIVLSKHDPLFSDTNVNTDWVITDRLSEQVVIERQLVTTLAQILLQPPPGLKDFTVVPEQLLWANPKAAGQIRTRSASVDTILFFSIVGLLIIERWISFKRMT